MRCPKCGYENDEAAKFCKTCGADLITGIKSPKPSPSLTTGCKIWLWIVFVVNILGAIICLEPAISALSYRIYTSFYLYLWSFACSGGMAVGAAMVLFKQKKAGFDQIDFVVSGNIIFIIIFCLFTHSSVGFVVFTLLQGAVILALSHYFKGKNELALY